MQFIREFIHYHFSATVVLFLVIIIVFILIEWLIDSAKKPSTRRFVLFISFSVFILYIFYNRLLRERLPTDLSVPINSLQKYIYIYIILINVIILILLLWEKYQDSKVRLNSSEESSFVFGLKKRVQRLSYDISLMISHSYLNIIYPAWQDIYHRFLIACFIRFTNLSYSATLGFFYGILIIPKSIVVSCFLWDILIKNELNLFYKVMWLLLIPLMFQFVRYNYLVIQNTTIEHIREELENDPHCFQGSQEDLLGVINNISQEELENASNQAYEFIKQKNAIWYKRLFYSLQEFFEDLKEKDGEDLYFYHLRVDTILSELPPTMTCLDQVKKRIRFPLNLCLRTLYIMGWVIILFSLKIKAEDLDILIKCLNQ